MNVLRKMMVPVMQNNAVTTSEQCRNYFQKEGDDVCYQQNAIQNDMNTYCQNGCDFKTCCRK